MGSRRTRHTNDVTAHDRKEETGHKYVNQNRVMLIIIMVLYIGDSQKWKVKLHNTLYEVVKYYYILQKVNSRTIGMKLDVNSQIGSL